VGDERMWTPLHWASNNSHLDAVKALIKYNADKSRKTIDVMKPSPLHRPSPTLLIDGIMMS